MKVILKYLILIGGIFPTACLQTAFGQYQSLRFERLTVEDGLPNPSVLDILQDRQGFIWIGTLSGIVRYDGYEMKTYLLSASMKDSLPTRNIPNFYEDKSGNIWVGFQYSEVWPKLYRYDSQTDRFIPYLFDPDRKKNPIAGGISTLREDTLGRLLAGTWGDGLFAIDIEKEKLGVAPQDLPFKHFLPDPNDKNTLSDDAISKGWGEDTDGDFWLPTDDGLCRFSPGADVFETFRFTTDTFPLANEFGVVFFEKPDVLWVGSAVHGLLKFDISEKKFERQFKHDPDDPFSISPGAVWKILKTRDGKYWLGAEGRFDIFDPGTERFTHITGEGGGDAGNGIFYWNNALIEDYSGNIWIGVWQQGIYKYNPGKGRFHLLRPDGKKLPGIEKLKALIEDSAGDLWLATDNEGLVRWNRKNNSIQRYRHQPGNRNSLSSNVVTSMLENPDGSFWVGTDAGLDKMTPDGRVLRHVQTFHNKRWNNNFRTRNGTLWVSAFESDPGFCRINAAETDTLRCFSSEMENLGAISSIVTIEEDRRGRLWLGINQFGFYIFDPETEKFTHHAPNYGVHDIHFDRHGNCWLATHSSGLKLWDEVREEVLHLPKEVHWEIGIVRDILEDDHGFFWLNTPGGVVKFDPQTRKVVQKFSRLQWMAITERWYQWGGCFKGKQGEMFFNSPTGVLYFHPDSLQADSIPSKVAITEMRLFGKKVLPGEGSPLAEDISKTEKIELAHWQNDLTFVFAALHFKSPAENVCLFMLENFDEDWQNGGADRSATYTNLNPGRYTFKVKAANSDGVWGEPVSLDINIRSPWWKTWWACLFYIVSGGGLLLGIRHYELKRQASKSEAKRLAELDSVKSKLYTNITHEFRTPLTIILGLADQLKAQASEGMKPGLDSIRRQGDRLLNLVNQMLDLAKLESGHLRLKPVQGEIVSFLKYIFESFHSLAKQKNISLTFHTNLETRIMDYDPERLQQVLVNLLANAFKFTLEGGRVRMEVAIEANTLQISVKDSGMGIRPNEIPHVFDRFYQADSSSTRRGEGTGIGLTLAKEMVNLMGGEITVESEFGKGANFTVSLPVAHIAPVDVNRILPALQPAAPDLLDEKALAAEVNKNADPGRPLLLVVEDNADVLRYLASILANSYQLIFATDGRQGIGTAFDRIPDLVISDVMMPGKDGFELCQTLKKDVRTSHIPVILLTAKADAASRITGLSRGADAYLAKPFNETELLTSVKALLELRAKLQKHYSGGKNREEAGMGLPANDAEYVFLEKVRQIVTDHLSDAQFNVAELAVELGMSKTQLYRKMTGVTGVSSQDFITGIRLKHAKKLLLNQSLSISQVAFQCGFSDPSYFSRIFKKEFGASPGSYRKTASS